MTDTPSVGPVAIAERAGIWCATTINGTAYVIDFDNMTVLRTPNPHDDDDAKNLRQDGDERPLLGVNDIAIGSNMVFILDIRGDGIPTKRRTSIVIRLEHLT